jgi:hypothetical protein
MLELCTGAAVRALQTEEADECAECEPSTVVGSGTSCRVCRSPGAVWCYAAVDGWSVQLASNGDDDPLDRARAAVSDADGIQFEFSGRLGECVGSPVYVRSAQDSSEGSRSVKIQGANCTQELEAPTT